MKLLIVEYRHAFPSFRVWIARCEQYVVISVKTLVFVLAPVLVLVLVLVLVPFSVLVPIPFPVPIPVHVLIKAMFCEVAILVSNFPPLDF